MDARNCPGTRFGDIPLSKRILARLILDARNLSVVKSALANGSGVSSPLPVGSRAIMVAMSRLLENGEWVLFEGPARALKPSAPGKPEAEMVPVDRADWRSADDEPVEAKKPAVAIEVEYEIEPVLSVECGFEIAPADSLETGYELESSEVSRAEAGEGAEGAETAKGAA